MIGRCLNDNYRILELGVEFGVVMDCRHQDEGRLGIDVLIALVNGLAVQTAIVECGG